MYRYFISYTYWTGKSTGFGNCEVQRSRPIMSNADAASIGDDIARNCGFDKVIVLNFQRLPEEG